MGLEHEFSARFHNGSASFCFEKLKKHVNQLEETDAIITKKIWANYVKKNSISKVNKANSNYYLSVVNGDFNFEEVQNNNKDCKKFYIYGPGCNHPPNSVYSDFTLVNLKPFPEELPAFKEEIIFYSV